MTTREALEKKEDSQEAAQSAFWSGETVASPSQQPGKLYGARLLEKSRTRESVGSDCIPGPFIILGIIST